MKRRSDDMTHSPIFWRLTGGYDIDDDRSRMAYIGHYLALYNIQIEDLQKRVKKLEKQIKKGVKDE